MFRVGDTLVPVIFIFDGTLLFNFAGNNNDWAIYKTMGNLPSKIRQMPSTHSVVMAALMPIPIMTRHIPEKELDQQR
jgi:hypothetical protein